MEAPAGARTVRATAAGDLGPFRRRRDGAGGGRIPAARGPAQPLAWPASLAGSPLRAGRGRRWHGCAGDGPACGHRRRGRVGIRLARRGLAGDDRAGAAGDPPAPAGGAPRLDGAQLCADPGRGDPAPLPPGQPGRGDPVHRRLSGDRLAVLGAEPAAGAGVPALAARTRGARGERGPAPLAPGRGTPARLQAGRREALRRRGWNRRCRCLRFRCRRAGIIFPRNREPEGFPP